MDRHSHPTLSVIYSVRVSLVSFADGTLRMWCRLPMGFEPNGATFHGDGGGVVLAVPGGDDQRREKERELAPRDGIGAPIDDEKHPKEEAADAHPRASEHQIHDEGFAKSDDAAAQAEVDSTPQSVVDTPRQAASEKDEPLTDGADRNEQCQNASDDHKQGMVYVIGGRTLESEQVERVQENHCVDGEVEVVLVADGFKWRGEYCVDRRPSEGGDPRIHKRMDAAPTRLFVPSPSVCLVVEEQDASAKKCDVAKLR